MESRVLLPRDGRAYAALRVHEAEEWPTQATAELRDELAAFALYPSGVIERYLADGTIVWGAFHGQTLAGAVAVSRRFSVQVLSYLWMWGLYVRPHYRGTPASRVLMSIALDWCEQQSPQQRIFGAYDVLNVRANRFSDRFGFQHPEESDELLGMAQPAGYRLVERVRR